MKNPFSMGETPKPPPQASRSWRAALPLLPGAAAAVAASAVLASTWGAACTYIYQVDQYVGSDAGSGGTGTTSSGHGGVGGTGAANGGMAGSTGTAACDGGLTSDPHNCGACGHDCLGGACQGGICMPVPLLKSVVAEALAVDSSALYIPAENNSNVTAGKILRFQIATSALTTLATQQNTPFGIAVDAANVYWTTNPSNPSMGGACNTPGTVMKVPKSGGSPVQVAFGQLFGWGIAVDASNVYWNVTNPCNSLHNAVMSCPLSGCAAGPSTLITAAGPEWGIASDGTSVFIADRGASDLLHIPVMGGASVVLATMQNQPEVVAVDATDVYWVAQTDGAVRKVSKTGGAVTNLHTGGNQPISLALDATHVYWVERGGNVMRVLKTGAGATLMASHPPEDLRAIAVDSQAVYYSAYYTQTIYKVAK